MEQVSFGYKTAWLALRTEDRDGVVRALGLRRVVSASPTLGIEKSHNWDPAAGANPIFVSPPVHGCVLCVGQALFHFVDARPPTFGDLIAHLSGELRCDVQFFCTHRVIESHGWARAASGMLIRAYLYVGESGETVLDYGEATPDELHLGFQLFVRSPHHVDSGAQSAYPSEEDVIRLARRWSVDPMNLPGMSDGLLGELPAESAARAARGATSAKKKPWWKVW